MKHVIEQLEAAERLSETDGVRKLTSSSSDYRIRIGDYRMGLAMEDGIDAMVNSLSC